MADQNIIISVVSIIFGGAGFGTALVQIVKNRGVLQTRHADELKEFRSELRIELAAHKAEAKRDSAAKDAKIGELSEDVKEANASIMGLQMQFALYRERVRLLIRHFRSGSSEWEELASTLESDQNDVDFLLKPRRLRSRDEETQHFIVDSRPHVLVIDDEEDTRRLVRFALEHRGYVVHDAPNALKGLELHEKAEGQGQTYALIILDYEMPDFDGEQVGRIIRISDKKTKIAFFTGHDPQTIPGVGDITDSVVWVKNDITAANILEKVQDFIAA